MASASGIRAGAAYYELRGDLGPLGQTLRQAEAKLRSWGNVVIGIGAGLSAFGAGLGGALMEGINVFRQAGAELTQIASVTGLTVERVGELQAAAVMLGGSIEDVSHGIVRMSRFLYEAEHGSHEARQSLAELGISLQEINSLNQDQRFIRLGEAIGRLTDPLERDALAMKVFGRGGADMMRMLTAGGASWDEAMRKARQMGLVMSKEDVDAANELNRAWKVMMMSIQGLWRTIGAALAPEFTRLVRLIADGVQAVTTWVRENAGLVSILDKVASLATVAGGALLGLGTTMRVLGMALGGLMPLWTVFSTTVTAAVSVVTTAISVGFGLAAGVVTGTLSVITGTASAMVGLLSGAASLGVGVLSTAYSVLTGAAGIAWSALMLLSSGIGAGVTAAMAGSGATGVFQAILVALGLASAGTTGSLGIFGTAVALVTGEITLAEAVTGAWLIPLVALLLPVAALTQGVIMLAVGVGLFATALGIAIPLTMTLAAVAVSLGAALVGLGAAILLPVAVPVIVAAIGSVIAAYFLLKAAWEVISDAASRAWEWIKDTTAAAIAWIGEKARQLWAGAVRVWEAIGNAAASVWESIESGTSTAIAWVGARFRELGQGIMSVWGTVNDSIQNGNWADALAVSWAGLKLLWVQVTNFLREQWVVFTNWLGDTFDEMWAGLKYGAQVAWAEVIRLAQRALVYMDPRALSEDWRNAQLRSADLDRDLAVGNARRDRDAATDPNREAARQRQEALAAEQAAGREREDAARSELERQQMMADTANTTDELMRQYIAAMSAAPGASSQLAPPGTSANGSFSGAGLAGLLTGVQRDDQAEMLEINRRTARATESLARMAESGGGMVVG